jgi:hypothetical protein
MTTSLHPLQTTDLIRNSYLRYLKTIYPFQEQDLRAQFWRALETPELLVKGPLLEASPPFEAGRSIEQLIDAGVLHPGFRALCSEALPLCRPLYLHQEQGIVKTVRDGRNVVIATGTGSGKTETFLLPILDHLLREQEAGTLAQPGVRALLLYPMNALANDQLKRLRRLLAGFPAITFGRYTGETEEYQKDAVTAFYTQFPDEPLLNNELISRERMRQAPPHLLLTNYAMLEYLLLRPKDCEFFDGNTGRHWRFLVIDEAHVYDGASGIEMAMLLRRLKDRVVHSEPGRLCCIATSATLGRGREDFPTVTTFGEEIFGERFEWQDDDPGRQDVVAATRLPMAAMGPAWGEGAPELYRTLRQMAPAGEDVSSHTIGELTSVARQHHVPAGIVTEAQQASTTARGVDAVNRCLYLLLRGDTRLRRLQDRLAEAPYFLLNLAGDLFPDREDSAERLIDLVDVAVRARPDANSRSLLPARYHVFARALEGAFVCLNADAPSHAREDHPRLFLTRQEVCPHCAGHVVEMATCVRCGTAYVVGQIVHRRPPDPGLVLHQLTGYSGDSHSEQAYFVLSDQSAGLDEDEAVTTGEDLDAETEQIYEPYTLCLTCGSIAPGRNVDTGCTCATSRITLYRVEQGKSPELRHCPACGARSNRGIVYRFLTGQDAPVSVLATALYQTLPESDDEDMRELPGQGRKLLAFADSRQDAAFFAPYLERTYRQVLRRRLILQALLEDEAGREGRLRVQDVTRRLLQRAEDAGLFTQQQSYDERQSLMMTWLMQELVAWDHRISLEGLGLLRFDLVRPDRWRPPQPLLESPWNLSPDEAWQVLQLLLNTLRRQGVVTFPPDVDPRGEAFEPRNQERLMREDRAEPEAHIFSWVPTQGNNHRLDILSRLLERTTSLSEEERRATALKTLRGLWRYLTDRSSPWRDHLPSENRSRVGVVHQISHAFWTMVPVIDTTAVFRCTRCGALSHINLQGVCPVYRCDGILEPVDANVPDWIQNHYRHLYQHLTPIPLSAEEHTAQWTSTAASTIQDRFVRGELNALSCSTTFELGVDVGELQAVLMRNVPPTTANYVQRAGRAGRRTDSAAFALTFAQRRSHDLTHYAHPERIVAGRIHPPVVRVRNEKIVRRHAQSVLFSAFFRWAYQEHERLFRNVGDFFDLPESGPTGPELLQDYIADRPVDVKQALERIIPHDLQDELGVADWEWLPNLWNEEGNGILDRVVGEVRDDLELLRRLADEAAGERTQAGYRRALHYQGVVQTVRGRDLLGFLGSRNVLPKYGFPTDVVELRTNHLPLPQAGRVELQRDLRVAIAEYAPGGEVVAAKHVWVSGGLNKRPDRNWPTYRYAVCPDCGRFYHSLDEIEGPCQICGANLYGYPRRYGTFVIPEFGFVVGETPRPSGEARPQRFYASRVYFADYATPDNEPGYPSDAHFEVVPNLSSAQVQIWQHYSRYGQLAVVNGGLLNRGFSICYTCGFAEPAPEAPTGRSRRRPPAHRNPRTGREPFAADVSEGKNDPIYNAHSYHTKVPHKAIMRYILHYTDPGDIVFDGFCGTG